MQKKKILSWNVNGIRAVHKKGMLLPLFDNKPDIVCLQETKAAEDQLPKELRNINGYHSYFTSAEKRGYSGVCIYTKEKPEKIEAGFGKETYDSEGRICIAYYPDFVVFNIYFPNGKASKDRLDYKMNFYDAFLKIADLLKNTGKNIIVCGDVNTAHTEIDLARPIENEGTSGFLPEERAWIDKLISHGYTDTFRMFIKEGGHYSWWDYKTRARERNIGWRIDYFFVSNNFKDKVKSAFILKDIMGSDHCPVGIEIDG
ncbi:MAG: exodeoxyribonuclease III [Spirochaetes bacterium]|nr:exodeoxyribonuclease III [Spirochaetota bacterium]